MKKLTIYLMAFLMSVSFFFSVAFASDNVEKKLTKVIFTHDDQEEIKEIVFSDPDDLVGTPESNDTMDKTPVITGKNLDVSFSIDPFIFTFTGIQLSDVSIRDENLLNLLSLKEQDSALFVVNASVECLSDNTYHFSMHNSKLVSNTKKQVESCWFLNANTDNSFLGNVIQETSTYFFLEKTSAYDIESLKMHIQSPSDSEHRFITKDFTVEFIFE